MEEYAEQIVEEDCDYFRFFYETK